MQKFRYFWGRSLQTFEQEGTRPLRLSLDTQGTGVCKRAHGQGTSSSVSFSRPLGWLKPGDSLQTLFGYDEIIPSQTHDPSKLYFSSEFGHFVKKYTEHVFS